MFFEIDFTEDFGAGVGSGISSSVEGGEDRAEDSESLILVAVVLTLLSLSSRLGRQVR